MHFSTATLTLALALTGITSALPTTTTTSILSHPSGQNILKPKTLSQYTVWTGAVDYNTPSGKIFKSGHTSDITTLLTFSFPPSTSGKMCQFHFALDPSSTSKVSGAGQFDLFTSLAPATGSTTTWPNGSLRDQQFGRVIVQAKGEATWVDGFPTIGQHFPCPAGQVMGMELVGTGDVDDIEWVAGGAEGAYVKVL